MSFDEGACYDDTCSDSLHMHGGKLIAIPGGPGVQGPVGPAGPAGPQGPPGSSGGGLVSAPTQSAFPVVGETNKVYLATDTGDAYRFDATAKGTDTYVRIAERVLSTGIEDSTQVGRALVTASSAAAARATVELGDSFDIINVKHHGVRGDGTTDDAAAIRKVALDNPTRSLYFPPGDYRCLTGLTFPNGNSLVLAPEARIYADAAMAILIDHTPNDLSTDGTPEYFQLVMDKSITGGTLDGNYLAQTILKVSRQTGNRITGILFLNPVKNGLWTARPGAEHIVTACTFRNLTDANNSATNTAIYNNSLATHYLDIVITDFNRGVFDDDSAMWTRCHVWNGVQTSRYANGTVCYETNGSSHFIQCYADTLQTGWKINDVNSNTRITFAVFFISDYYYTTELAATYPPTVLNVPNGARVTLTESAIYGHPAGDTPLVTGYTGKFSATGNLLDSKIRASQRGDWIGGIQQGKTSFIPRFVGKVVAGTHTYTEQYGVMTVSGNLVHYQIRLTGKLDSTIDGDLQIAGIPTVVSPYPSKGGIGSVGYHSGVGDVRMVSQAGSNSNFVFYGVNTTTGSSVVTSATAMRGTTISMYVTLTGWIDQANDFNPAAAAEGGEVAVADEQRAQLSLSEVNGGNGG